MERRPDNFHNIESIFFPIPLKDALEAVIDPNLKPGEIHFTFSGLSIPGDENSNLCVKAYRLIHKNHPLPGIRAHLHKNIPMGAGLGGGSSDAAFFIQILNQLAELNLNTNEKHAIASQLGSDCAFFIENKAAFCYGRGELFEPINLNLQGFYLVLVYPSVHISTQEAYAGVMPHPSNFDLRNISLLPMDEWKNIVKNDFEESIFPKHPQLKALKETLYKLGAEYASMTGSGSSVFGLFKNKIEVDELKKYGQVWIEEL